MNHAVQDAPSTARSTRMDDIGAARGRELIERHRDDPHRYTNVTMSPWIACARDRATRSTRCYTEVDASPAVHSDALFVGGAHACVIDGQRVRCWGANEHGQSSTAPEPWSSRWAEVPLPGALAHTTELSLDVTRSCVRRDGQSWCWGDITGVGAPQQITADPRIVVDEVQMAPTCASR